MGGRFWAVVLPLAALSPAAAEDGPTPFGATTVWPVHVVVPAAEYDAMQPPKAGPPTDRAFHRNEFGVVLPWAAGSVTVGGRTFDRVGVRYKGNGTIGDAAKSAKKSFKIDLDRFDKNARFGGLKTLNLHCGVADPSKLRETLGYAVYRAAGVPASRTAFAEVRLTVPGKFDAELLGLYTLVEDVGAAFLSADYGTDAGLLMKPVSVRDVNDLGDDWEKYKGPYAPKRDATPAEARRVIGFAKLVHKAGDAEFRRDIGSYLDIDAYLRFLAVSAMVVNTDDLFGLGHNYYLYLHPDGRFHFIPWDLDRAFANTGVGSSLNKVADLSLMHPYSGTHRLTERVLASPGATDKYRAICREVAAMAFARDRLLKEIDALEAVTKESAARDAAAAVRRKDRGPWLNFGRVPDPRAFVAARTASVTAQLAGTSPGRIPPTDTPPGEMLGWAFLESLDRDGDGRLSKAEWEAAARRAFAAGKADDRGRLTEAALAAGLNRMLPLSPDDEPPPPTGGFGGFMAGPIVKAADADKDGAVTLAEVVAAAGALFDAADTTGTGKLDEDGVGAMLNRLQKPPTAKPKP